MIKLLDLLREVSVLKVFQRGKEYYNTSELFPNRTITPENKEYNKLAEYFTESDISISKLPIKEIPLNNNFYHHQELVSVEKVKDILNKNEITDMNNVLIGKINNNYYLMDGHTRVASQILKGNKTIKGHIFNISNF